MASAATHLHPAEQADQQAEDAQYYRRVLHELIDMGTDLARAVPQQGTAQAGAEEPDAATMQGAAVAFDRISRCVRRTVALARKIAEPLPARPAATCPGQHRVAARRRILREVEDAIQREAGGVDAEALGAELHERLDAPELDDEIGDRPVAEVITEICRDLGLLTLLGNHPWKRRTPRDVADLCARAAQAPGAVSAGPPEAPPPAAAPAAPGCGETWAGPPPYSRDASIELMHQLLALRPPIRGP